MADYFQARRSDIEALPGFRQLDTELQQLEDALRVTTGALRDPLVEALKTEFNEDVGLRIGAGIEEDVAINGAIAQLDTRVIATGLQAVQRLREAQLLYFQSAVARPPFQAELAEAISHIETGPPKTERAGLVEHTLDGTLANIAPSISDSLQTYTRVAWHLRGPNNPPSPPGPVTPEQVTEALNLANIARIHREADPAVQPAMADAWQFFLDHEAELGAPPASLFHDAMDGYAGGDFIEHVAEFLEGSSHAALAPEIRAQLGAGINPPGTSIPSVDYYTLHQADIEALRHFRAARNSIAGLEQERGVAPDVLWNAALAEVQTAFNRDMAALHASGATPAAADVQEMIDRHFKSSLNLAHHASAGMALAARAYNLVDTSADSPLKEELRGLMETVAVLPVRPDPAVDPMERTCYDVITRHSPADAPRLVQFAKARIANWGPIETERHHIGALVELLPVYALMDTAQQSRLEQVWSFVKDNELNYPDLTNLLPDALPSYRQGDDLGEHFAARLEAGGHVGIAQQLRNTHGLGAATVVPLTPPAPISNPRDTAFNALDIDAMTHGLTHAYRSHNPRWSGEAELRQQVRARFNDLYDRNPAQAEQWLERDLSDLTLYLSAHHTPPMVPGLRLPQVLTQRLQYPDLAEFVARGRLGSPTEAPNTERLLQYYLSSHQRFNRIESGLSTSDRGRFRGVVGNLVVMLQVQEPNGRDKDLRVLNRLSGVFARFEALAHSGSRVTFTDMAAEELTSRRGLDPDRMRERLERGRTPPPTRGSSGGSGAPGTASPRPSGTRSYSGSPRSSSSSNSTPPSEAVTDHAVRNGTAVAVGGGLLALGGAMAGTETGIDPQTGKPKEGLSFVGKCLVTLGAAAAVAGLAWAVYSHSARGAGASNTR